MSYLVYTTKKFDKALKKCIKRGFDPQRLKDIVKSLIDTGTVDKRYRPHKLSGDYEGYWECHIQGDWVLVWDQDDDRLTLLLIDTGTHSDIFK